MDIDFLQSQFNRSLEECAALQTGSAARRYCETKSADDIIICYRISKLVIFLLLSYVEQTDDLNWPIRNADNDRKIHPFTRIKSCTTQIEILKHSSTYCENFHTNTQPNGGQKQSRFTFV